MTILREISIPNVQFKNFLITKTDADSSPANDQRVQNHKLMSIQRITTNKELKRNKIHLVL